MMTNPAKPLNEPIAQAATSTECQVNGKECALNPANSSKGFQAVLQHFKDRNWRYETDETALAVHATFALKHATPRCAAFISRNDDLFHFVSILPVLIPADKRQAISEACSQASWALNHGRFEINMQDGEVRFRTSLPYPKGQLSDGMIRRVLSANLFTVDAYFPAFMRIVYAGRTPTDAVRDIEQPIAAAAQQVKRPSPEAPPRVPLACRLEPALLAA